VAVPRGEFLRSIPALAVRIPFFMVRRNPGTPPRILSDSHNTKVTSRGSIPHLRESCLAVSVTRTLFSLASLPSLAATTLLETAMTSPLSSCRSHFAKAPITALPKFSPTRTVGSLTGISRLGVRHWPLVNCHQIRKGVGQVR
jgi:hypothetical protein